MYINPSTVDGRGYRDDVNSVSWLRSLVIIGRRQSAGALEVCSRQGAIQIHVYLTLSYLTGESGVWRVPVLIRLYKWPVTSIANAYRVQKRFQISCVIRNDGGVNASVAENRSHISHSSLPSPQKLGEGWARCLNEKKNQIRPTAEPMCSAVAEIRGPVKIRTAEL